MQTNTVMSERLYEIAIEFAELAADDVVWDLYCGAGALGLLAARAGAGSVSGIEIHAESVERARENAAAGWAFGRFVAGEIARAVRPLLERARGAAARSRVTAGGVDAAKKGGVVELAPRRLARCTSCNLITLGTPTAPSSPSRDTAGGRSRSICSRTLRTIECVAGAQGGSPKRRPDRVDRDRRNKNNFLKKKKKKKKRGGGGGGGEMGRE